MALANPLLDFDSILFVKRAPGMLPHMSDQYYGWWSRPGGGIYVLDGFKGPSPRLRCLTRRLARRQLPPARPVLRRQAGPLRLLPLLSRTSRTWRRWTRRKLPEDAFYHVFEMNVDGTGVRQLTHGRYDDFDARYLPNGDIVFLSTRKGTFLQCTTANTAATLAQTLPDSYVRCGGDN